MGKMLFKCAVVALAAAVFLEMPSANAILGIRAARTAIAARRAAHKMSGPDEAGKKEASGKRQADPQTEEDPASSQNAE